MNTMRTFSSSMMINTRTFSTLTPTRTSISDNIPRVTTIPNTNQSNQAPIINIIDIDVMQKFIE